MTGLGRILLIDFWGRRGLFRLKAGLRTGSPEEPRLRPSASARREAPRDENHEFTLRRGYHGANTFPISIEQFA